MALQQGRFQMALSRLTLLCSETTAGQAEDSSPFRHLRRKAGQSVPDVHRAGAGLLTRMARREGVVDRHGERGCVYRKAAPPPCGRCRRTRAAAPQYVLSSTLVGGYGVLECGENPAKREPHRFPAVSGNALSGPQSNPIQCPVRYVPPAFGNKPGDRDWTRCKDGGCRGSGHSPRSERCFRALRGDSAAGRQRVR